MRRLETFGFLICALAVPATNGSLASNLVPSTDRHLIRVPSDAPTIAAALAIAGPGDMVLVARGTYNEHDLPLAPGVILAGEGVAAETVIDAQGGGVVVHRVPGSGLARMRHLTVKGGLNLHGGIYAQGSIDIEDCIVTGNRDWGIYARGPGVVTIRRTVVTENGVSGVSAETGPPREAVEEWTSGGIYSFFATRLTLTDCRIANNETVGVMADGDRNSFVRCEVVANTLDGIVLPQARDVISDCVITDHPGAGVTVIVSLDVVRSTIARNGTALRCMGAYLELDDSLVHHNGTAFFLGIAYYNASRAEITRSTVAENGQGLIIHCGGYEVGCSSAVLDHSILSGGVPIQSRCEEVLATCSDIFPSAVPLCYEVVGKHWVVDPEFCDADAGDFRLAPGSPLLGNGCGQIGAFGSCEGLAGRDASFTEVPSSFRGPDPNPSAGAVRFTLQLEVPGVVMMRIYDVQGRLVRGLDLGTQPAGRQAFEWDRRNDAGMEAASGTYICQIDGPGLHHTRKVVLIAR